MKVVDYRNDLAKLCEQGFRKKKESGLINI